MMKAVSLTVLRLQAAAFRKHGISQEQFLKLTPKGLQVLDDDWVKEKEFEISIEDRRIARLLAAIYNTAPNRKRGRTFSEDDFMPQKRTENQSAESLLSKMGIVANTINSKSKKS